MRGLERSWSVFWVEGNCFLEGGDCPRHAGPRALAQVMSPQQELSICGAGGDGVTRRCVSIEGGGDLVDERGDDRVGHRVLSREFIGQVEIVTLSAEVCSGVVEVLDADPGPGALDPQRSFEQVSHTECVGQLA